MDYAEPDTEAVEISSYTPPVMRWILGVFAFFMMVVPLHELGRGVWPINLLTPFFGILLGICIAMGSLLMAAVIWGPDVRWVIADGNVSIIYQRFGKTLTIYHPHTDFQSSTIEVSDSDSGPDTYVIALRLTNEDETGRIPPEFVFLPAWLTGPIVMVRNQMVGHKMGLRSPHFKDRPDAEAALSRLMSA